MLSSLEKWGEGVEHSFNWPRPYGG